MNHLIRDVDNKDIATFCGEVPRPGESMFIATKTMGLIRLQVNTVQWAVFNGNSRACVYGVILETNLPKMTW